MTEKEAQKRFGKEWLDKALNEGGPVRVCDYSESPSQVLEAVNDQLKPHGLKVVLIDTGDDSYVWFVDRL